jgi:hypothetical protein
MYLRPSTHARLGLSRNEYVRREFKIVAQRSASSITVEDLQRFSERFPDLINPELMDRAWE